MSRNKDFSIDLKMRIFQVYKQKEGGYKKLGKRFDVGHSSVANIIQTCLKKESQGLDPFEVVRQGRKKITSVRTDREIFKKVKVNPFITSK